MKHACLYSGISIGFFDGRHPRATGETNLYALMNGLRCERAVRHPGLDDVITPSSKDATICNHPKICGPFLAF